MIKFVVCRNKYIPDEPGKHGHMGRSTHKLGLGLTSDTVCDAQSVIIVTIPNIHLEKQVHTFIK